MTQIDCGRRRVVRGFALFTPLVVAGCAATDRAPQADSPQEGFEYRAARSPQPAVVTAGRIDVAEFFWFGCPHCNAMEPQVEAWVKRLPPEVAFRKVHVGLSERQQVHQRLFWTLESMGRSPALTPQVFRAIHGDGRELATREQCADFVASRGVDRAAFLAAFDSPAVTDAMARANDFARAMGVEGVPSFAVAGQWLTSPGMAGSYASALSVADTLIARERGARRG